MITNTLKGREFVFFLALVVMAFVFPLIGASDTIVHLIYVIVGTVVPLAGVYTASRKRQQFVVFNIETEAVEQSDPCRQ